MTDPKDKGKTTGKGKKSRKGWWIAGIVIILLGLLILVPILVVPAYISSESGKSMIVSRINDSIDGEVAIADLSFGWGKGISATGVDFNNREKRTRVNVARVAGKPHLLALLGGNIAVENAVVEKPEVEITVTREQAEDIFRSEEDDDEPVEVGEGMDLEKFEMALQEGKVQINLEEADGQVSTLLFRDIASKVDLNKPGKKSDFSLSLAVAENGSEAGEVTADGSVTPDEEKGWRFKEGTKGTFKVNVKKLDISSLRPLFALAGKDMQADGELNAQIDVQIADGQVAELVADARLRDFTQLVGGKKTTLAEPVTFDAKVATVDGKMVINSLDLKSGFMQAQMTGDAESIDYTANADLAAVQDFATQFIEAGPYEISGKLQAQGNAKMTGKAVRTTGETTVENLVLVKTPTQKRAQDQQQSERQLAAEPVRTEPTNLTIRYDLTKDNEKQALTVNTMQLNTQPNIAAVRMENSTLPMGRGYEALDATINAQLSLAEIAAFAKTFGMIPADMILQGQAESLMMASGTKELVTIQSDKTVVNELLVQKKGQEEKFEDPSVKVNFKAVLEPAEKTINQLDVDVESKYIEVEKGNIRQTTLDGQRQLEGEFVANYDLARVTPLIQPFMPVPVELAGKRKSEISFATRYVADEGAETNVFENMTGKANFGFDGAKVMGLNLGMTDVNIDIEGGVLNVRPFETAANDGKIRFGGSVDLREEQREFRTAEPIQVVENVSINDEMSAEMLKFVNPLFAKQADVDGVVNFRADEVVLPLGEGREKEMKISGVVGMSKVNLATVGLLGQLGRLAKGTEGEIEVLPTEFSLADGVLAYDKMQVNFGDNPVYFKGRIGLDKSLSMQLDVPLDDDFDIANLEDDVAMRVPLPLAGTVDNPQFDLQKAVGLIATERAKMELRRALGGDKEEKAEADGEGEEKAEGEQQGEQKKAEDEDIEERLKKEGQRILEDIFK